MNLDNFSHGELEALAGDALKELPEFSAVEVICEYLTANPELVSDVLKEVPHGEG